MKKLILLVMLISGIASAQEDSGFKMNGGSIIWQHIYQDSLNIESHKMTIAAPAGRANKSVHTKSPLIGLHWVFFHDAELKAEHKEGRTRITISRIEYYSDVSIAIYGIRAEVSQDFLEKTVIKHRNGKYRKWFIKRDAPFLGQYFNEYILSRSTTSNTDW